MLEEMSAEYEKVKRMINNLNRKWTILKGFFPKPVNFIVGVSKRDHPSTGDKQLAKNFSNILDNTVLFNYHGNKNDENDDEYDENIKSIYKY